MKRDTRKTTAKTQVLGPIGMSQQCRPRSDAECGI